MLSTTATTASDAVNGRDYFRAKERELRIEGLDPASVQQQPAPAHLKDGPNESPMGGRLARDLKQLSAEETALRQERSEAFLSQPPTEFPADDAISDDENSD